MRRWLQLTLLAAMACRTDRPAPNAPTCAEPGDPSPDARVGKAVGRYPLDREGCLFVDVSEDGGVRRTATEGRHAGVWRVHFEQLVSPGQVVERSDGDADGHFEKRELHRFSDAGWLSSEAETDDENGQRELRWTRTRIDSERMRVVRERHVADGGWQFDEAFEASIQQR